MSEPSKMEQRPPVKMICYISAEGNPHTITTGCNEVSEIRETQEFGEFGFIPWIEVWAGDQLMARFPQNKLEHVIYCARGAITNG